MQDLWRLSAAEIASLIRSKKVSAKEAATAALARLDAVNPKINAVVDHRPEDVLAQASAVDAAIGRGEDAGETRCRDRQSRICAPRLATQLASVVRLSGKLRGKPPPIRMSPGPWASARRPQSHRVAGGACQGNS
jgi:hypothetical protein